MSKLNIQLCPETGICSIIKQDGSKVDLMPDEVKTLKGVLDKPDAARQVLAEADAGFAQAMAPEDLRQLAARLK